MTALVEHGTALAASIENASRRVMAARSRRESKARAK